MLLIGRTTSTSKPLDSRNYSMHRMSLPFEKGPLFYASYNIGLFLNLLFRRADLLFSNDLDTLLPNFMVSKLKRTPLIYDSHEFFTEVPELVDRPKVQGIWKRIERMILPKLKWTLTVNASISGLYKDLYGVEMKVLRNVPMASSLSEASSRQELGLPTDKKIIILQGSGINMHRGAEEAVDAMQYMQGALLLILGSGDVVPFLKQRVQELKLQDKVMFKDRMPYTEMMAHTQVSDLGLSLDKDTNVNYRFSLPNKLFDYIQAGIPVLGSDLVEVKRIILDYGVGQVVTSFDPEQLAEQMQGILASEKMQEWKKNAQEASSQLTWENESKVLSAMIDQVNG